MLLALYLMLKLSELKYGLNKITELSLNYIKFNKNNLSELLRLNMRSLKKYRPNYFSCIGPRLFNIIPLTIWKTLITLEALKSRLAKFLIKIADKPPTSSFASVNSNSLLELTYFIYRIAADMMLDGATVDSLGASWLDQ